MRKALRIAKDSKEDRAVKLQNTIDFAETEERARRYQYAQSVAQEGKMEEALDLAEDAFSFQIETKRDYAQPATLCSIGQILIALGQPKQGVEKFRDALKIAEKTEVDELISSIRAMLSTLESELI